MASNLDFERCGGKYITNGIYNDLLQYSRSTSHLDLRRSITRIIQNELQLYYMAIKDYFNVIYELFYNHIHLFILAIMEFYRKFLNIMENMKKKAIIKHIVNDKINQIQDKMMQYQLKKTSSTLYIGNRIILCGL
eukprot:248677_1